MSEVIGFLDTVTSDGVEGWAMRKSDITPITVFIQADGQEVGSVVAKRFRPDLKEMGTHPNGNCGFEFDFPKHIARSGYDMIRVFAGEERTELRFSPYQVSRYASSAHRSFLENENSNDTYFFVHIPKTAGSSFRDMMLPYFKEREIFPNSIDMARVGNMYPLYDLVLRKFVQVIPQVRFMTGHYPYSFRSLLSGTPRVLTLLREPVSRTLSHLRHLSLHDKELKGRDLMDIYIHDRYWQTNLQVKHFMGSGIEGNLYMSESTDVTERDYQQARVNLGACDLVGITEYFDLTVMLARKIFPLNLGPPILENVTPMDHFPPVEQELIEMILSREEYDLRFYRDGMALFKEKLQKYGLELTGQ